MTILLRAYQLGGKTLFRLFLFPVALFYALFHRTARQASSEYLQRMHQFNRDFPTPRFWHWFVHLWSFASTMLDKLAVWTGKISQEDVVLHGGEVIDEQLKSGQGAMVLISHLGNFDVCQALSENRPGLKLTVLHHTESAEKFNQFLKRHRRETTVEFMQVKNLGVSQAIQLSDCLSNGRFVAMGADRVSIDYPDRAKLKPFLGENAAFPVGPFILASALKTTVISVHCLKNSADGKYHIYFDVLDPDGRAKDESRDNHIDRLMHAYVKNLEHHCVDEPWQWFNFYSFWDTTEAHQ